MVVFVFTWLELTQLTFAILLRLRSFVAGRVVKGYLLWNKNVTYTLKDIR